MARSRSPKKKRAAARSKKKPSTPLRRWKWRGVGVLLLVSIVAGIVYLAILNQRVIARFEGQRWELPARVYARPLELFVGLPLTPAQFEAELAELDYQRPFHPSRPGTASFDRPRYRLSTRPFVFWDGAELSVPVDLVIADGKVHSLRHAVNGSELSLVRLDPAPIANIYPLHHEDRVLIKTTELPELFVAGLIEVEDRRFESHHGIDFRGLARAMWVNLKARRWVQGGSTLSQQLVKNFYLTADRSLWRKANEAVMAVIMELHFEKAEIIETYLNEIYMGQNGPQSIHGIGLASRFYFSQDVGDLTPARQALLVGLIRGPSQYNPRAHPQRALALRNQILKMWHAAGLIDDANYQRARAESLGVTLTPPRGDSRYPAFLDLVRRQLREDYREEDLRSEGLRIFTTLAPGVQSLAEKAVSQRVGQFNQPELESAFVIARPGSGEVLALGGGRDAQFAGFNRALDAYRPLGSLFKPLIYLEALSTPARYTLISPLVDTPLEVSDGRGGIWKPQNYNQTFEDEVRLVDALARSRNIPSVRLGLDVGLGKLVKKLQAIGVTRHVPAYPSALLGAVDLSPLEVTQIYQLFAAGGFKIPLRAIREVQDAHAQPLNRYPVQIEPLADPAAVYLVDYALQAAVRRGTGKALAGMLPKVDLIAGKTGTTNDYRDSWFAGYTEDLLGVVWLGRDDNKPTGLTGSSGALRVWGAIFAPLSLPSTRRSMPASIEWQWIDPASGSVTQEHCPDAQNIPFITGSVPAERVDCPGARFRQRVGDMFDWLRN